MQEYDKIKSKYKTITEIDPSKLYVQYYNLKKMLGNVSEKKILDVGCGNGLLTSEIALKKASLTGYDISGEQIKLARKLAKKLNLNITYLVANQDNINKKLSQGFDKAYSNMVLSVAENKKALYNFFKSTYDSLKSCGEFISITFNPNYKRLNQQCYNRIFGKDKQGMFVKFYKENEFMTMARFTEFTRKDYEIAAKQAGFKKVKWVKLKISKQGKKHIGKKFWKGYEKDCPYVGFIAKK